MTTQVPLSSIPLPEIADAVDRFEQRAEKGLFGAPPTVGWVRDAVRRKGAPRCPVRLKRTTVDIIVRHGDALADLLCEFPDDVLAVIPYDICIGYQPPGKQPHIDPLAALTRGMEWVDEWGVRWGHAEGGVGATPVAYPLADWDDLDDYLARCVPDPRAPGRLAASAAVLRCHAATRYCYGIIHMALFERLHALRGMDATFVDLHASRTHVERLLDTVEAYLVELIGAWGEAGAHAVFLTDDWGSQTSLLISPAMWRAIFRPRYARLVAEAHRLGMDFILHSCGNVIDIVGDLADIGVDVLDPVQPGAMDFGELARRFGGSLAFSGAIDVQHLLVDGTPGEVKDAIRRTVECLARPFGNALMIGPANVMMPEIPLANLRAMFEACHG